MAVQYAVFLLLIIASSPDEVVGQNPIQTLFQMSSQIYFNNTFRDVDEFLPEYDFIIVGAGSSGAVLASRLTEMEDFTVLLLEAGKDENLLTEVPVLAPVNQLTSVNWGYKAEKNPTSCLGLVGEACNWPKGKVVGGTSVLNFMVYNRGHRKDYDNWRDKGNYGWGYEDVLEYFKKIENVKPRRLRKSPYRGTSGPMPIEESKFQTKILDAFLKTGKSLGYPNNDPNGEELLGFSKIQATLKNGRRCSTAKAYLRPIVDRPNFYLSTHSRVTKVMINPESKAAYGVEFLKDKKFYQVRAKREVILSAGPIASPQLLMLSGIGPKEHLDQFKIHTIQDLPVGYNLHDHACVPGLSFTIEKPYSIRESDMRVNPFVMLEYLVEGSGPMTLPGGSEGYSFVKVANSTLPDDYPDIEIVMGPGGLHSMSPEASAVLLGMPAEFLSVTFGNIFNRHGFSLVPVLLKPKSRGRISLKSANPLRWPRMESGLFSEPEDVKVLIEGIKLSLKIAESPYFKKMGTKFNPNPFYGCEHEEFLSDAYWECCIRRISTTIQHQVGTCKMGPNWDKSAVVNPELQVYGVHNLRVVDTSILPEIIAGHTNSVAMMIGEKAADMIKKYWVNQILIRK